jgi:hypothetical protein
MPGQVTELPRTNTILAAILDASQVARRRVSAVAFQNAVGADQIRRMVAGGDGDRASRPTRWVARLQIAASPMPTRATGNTAVSGATEVNSTTGACPCSARHWHEDCAALIIGISPAQQAWPPVCAFLGDDAQHLHESQPFTTSPRANAMATARCSTRLMCLLEHEAAPAVKTEPTQPIQSPSSRTCQPCGTRLR